MRFSLTSTKSENIFQPQTQMLDNIVKLSVLIALVFLMTGLGVTMEPGKIWQHAKRPVGAVVATIVQFGVMPFIAWGIGTFMNVVLFNAGTTMISQ